MAEQLRYITNEQGARVGVLLELDEYVRLKNRTVSDPELLVGVDQPELQALADSMLAPTAQDRLDELLARNTETQLSAEDGAELDRLLTQVDNLTVLKTRARYTLQSQAS